MTPGPRPSLPVVLVPTTVPTTPRPTTTVPARPSAPTTTTVPPPPVVRSTSASFGPLVPGAVEIPFSGRRVWEGVSNGVSISVRTNVDAPRVGDLIDFDIELASPARPCCGLVLMYSDGFISADRNGWSCPSGGPHGPGPVRFHTSHVFNLDGRWTFDVQAITGNCETPTVAGSLFGTIEIGRGTSTAQGPALPQVRIGLSGQPPGHADDFSWLSLSPLVTEEDGWIRSITIDWGDGSRPGVYAGTSFDGGVCQSTAAGWPAADMRLMSTGQAVHHYLAPGTYRVTATAVSTACDGSSERQTGTDQLTWRVQSVPASG